MNDILKDIWKKCETCKFNDGYCPNKDFQEPCGCMKDTDVKLFEEAKLKENWINTDKLFKIYKQLKEQSLYTANKIYNLKQALENIEEYCISTIKANKDLNEDGDCILGEILRIIKECKE